MNLKELHRKAKIHVTEVAVYKSFSFAFYRLLVILSRRIALPDSVFTFTVTGYQGETHLKKFMLPEGDGCFIDVGANVGFWTMFVAREGFDIHAFEPSPRPYRILRHRTRTLKNVRTYLVALGEKPGVTNMKVMKSFSRDSQMGVIGDNPTIKAEDVIDEIEVKIRTLDSYEIRRVSVIKIDTEGFEIPILRGAEKTILRDGPRLIIEVHFPPFREEAKRIVEILEGWGYTWKIINKINLGVKTPQPHIIGEKDAHVWGPSA